MDPSSGNWKAFSKMPASHTTEVHRMPQQPDSGYDHLKW